MKNLHENRFKQSNRFSNFRGNSHWNQPSKKTVHSFRFYLLAIIFIILFGALLWRMLELSIFNRNFLVKQNEARTLRTIQTPGHRGMILDRNDRPLAVSTEVSAVWMNPKIFEASESELAELAKHLDLSATSIEKKTEQNQSREFVYLKRGLPPEKALQIKKLKIPGIFFQKEHRRFYPEGEVFSHVLGFTNIDQQGQEGLELTYNEWLKGKPGKKQVLKDRLGHIISEVREISQPQNGNALTLSLDNRIQYLAWRSLKEEMDKHKIPSGSVIVMNPKTGEILAMVNLPSYNPNQRPQKHDGRYRNRAVTDLFEPGSTIKTFTIIDALESGKYTPESEIDTKKGYFKAGKKIIRDMSRYGVVTLTEALKKSSEVAIIKVTLSLSPESLFQVLRKFGFGEKTNSGFHGEVAGSLIERQKWQLTEHITLSYGYGLSVTALQLAQAYSILAAEGMKYPVTFLKRDSLPNGEMIISADVSEKIVKMLESVTKKGGTGHRASIPGYRVSGKTGTAYTAENGGYNEKKYTASFAGIAPTSDPQLVAVVVMHNVTGAQHFGGQIAAPVFQKVMGGALRILNIPPDTL